MPAGVKFVAQFTRSFFLSKRMLKGMRCLILMYVFTALMVGYARHFDYGANVFRWFTSIIMLIYFILVLAASYKFKSLELSHGETVLANTTSAFFTLATTSALFDVIMFWVFFYRYYHPQLNFYVINFFIVNLVIMVGEIFWSLMVIPLIRFVYALLGAIAYVGVYFAWEYLDRGYIFNKQVFLNFGLPLEAMVTITVVVVYMASFLVSCGFVQVRYHIYNHGLFTKEETFHILESQKF